MQANPVKKTVPQKVEPDKRITPKDNIPKKTSNASAPGLGSTLSENAQRSAYNSLANIMSKSRNSNSSHNSSKKASWKRKPVKPYEPIRLPKEILTIQAHSASTPVTELPYLLIAAHIGSLQSGRQFYPTTSSSVTPLTVFRDIFVMTMDVRGYKPGSVRLSTEGRLVIIECLQSEVPPVEFTQTGTVDSNDKYVMDPSPNIQQMPVHTTFNYMQHRVKLPDDFSEEGLKVGMDDVTGHVIITGRLVHNQNTAFPESWNTSAARKPSKGPIINTSSSSLSPEDARKLAAWHAVQSQPKLADQALGTAGTATLIECGRKQWLEREGAKLRALQHRALKGNIEKLNKLKKIPVSLSKSKTMQGQGQSLPTISEVKSGIMQLNPTENNLGSATDLTRATSAGANQLGPAGSAFIAKIVKSDGREVTSATKFKESRPKVSFQQLGGNHHLAKMPSATYHQNKGKNSKQKLQHNFKHKPNAFPDQTSQHVKDDENKDTAEVSINENKEQPLLEVQGNPATLSLKGEEILPSNELQDDAEASPDSSKMIRKGRSDNQNITTLSQSIPASSSPSCKIVPGKSNPSTNLHSNFNILGTNIANYHAVSNLGGNDVSPFKELSPKRENSPSSSPLASQTPKAGLKVWSPKGSPGLRTPTLGTTIFIAPTSPSTQLVPTIKGIITPDRISEPGSGRKTPINQMPSNSTGHKLLSSKRSKSELTNSERADLEEFSDLMNPELVDSDDPVGSEDKSIWEKILLHAQAHAIDNNEE